MKLDIPSYYRDKSLKIQCGAKSQGTGSNIVYFSAVSGKRIRILGMVGQGDAGVSIVTLKSASGGSNIMAPIAFPSNAAPPAFVLPICEWGYGETNVGEGIYMDVATSGIFMSLFVVTYTPV